MWIRAWGILQNIDIVDARVRGKVGRGWYVLVLTRKGVKQIVRGRQIVVTRLRVRVRVKLGFTEMIT